MRRMSGGREDDLTETATGGRVPLQHRAGLSDHRLRRAGILAGPPRHVPQLAQVGQIEHGSVRDDQVGVPAHPDHRRLRRDPHQRVGEGEPLRRHRVQHTAGAGRGHRPVLTGRGVTRVVVLTDHCGQKAVQHGLLVGAESAGVGRVERTHDGTGTGRVVSATIRGRQPLHELGVHRTATATGVVRRCRRTDQIARRAKAVRRDRSLEQHTGEPSGQVHQQLHDHAAAHRVAGHHGTDCGRTEQGRILEQRRDVVGEVAQPPARIHRRRLGSPVATQIGGHHAPVRRQQPYERRPVRTGGTVPVYEQ